MTKRQLELQVEQSIRTDFTIDWADSNTFIPDEQGNLKSAGTCLLFNTSITYLQYLTKSQLESLKETVSEAVNHELSKRD